MSSTPLRSHAPLLEIVLDQIGSDIVSGKIQPGEKFTLQTLCESFSISRTVARETMRALEHLGMVSSSRRVGITVLPTEKWSVFSGPIIRWRLRVATQRDEQLNSLTALREAVAPRAARIAAIAASQREGQRLRDLASTMRELGEQGKGDTEDFLEANIEYHSLLLSGSDNEMFTALIPSITAVIQARHDINGFEASPSGQLLACYNDLADALFDRDDAKAEQLCKELIELEGSSTVA
ncbi:HTH-type transcriptional regulator LutR [Corynebacterium kalinowskii]|uniref:HTH-type transcriptional regulator LutR n=1 Tax=Corynebacterium kalinowskii TaxID=2675216 RepID=A0A6B8V8E5_9CORY|nr:FCD domain-containing protein [Corynebacterium kalinowskii]QGU01382.1 HTH-type transcriptional regulator LutR [Corynebacterium kalinowskii]